MKIVISNSGEFVASNFSSSLDCIYRSRYLALVPVVIACVLSTGYQYLTRLSELADYEPATWHEGLVQSIILDSPDITILNIAISGLACLIPVFVVAVLVGGICERIFAMQRGRAFNTGFIYVALLFTLLIPPVMSVFHVSFGMIFGLLFGREIFGGEGKSFLNPALVGAAFLQIAFPGFLTDSELWPMLNGYAGSDRFNQLIGGSVSMSGTASVSVSLINQVTLWDILPVAAAFVGGGYLLLKNLVISRLVVGIGIGILTASFVASLIQAEAGLIPWYTHFVWGGLVFAVFFVAADPSNACVTNTGRWLQGLTMGWLLVFLRSIHPTHPEFTIPVLFLGSLLAPLIDQVVVIVHSKIPSDDHV